LNERRVSRSDDDPSTPFGSNPLFDGLALAVEVAADDARTFADRLADWGWEDISAAHALRLFSFRLWNMSAEVRRTGLSVFFCAPVGHPVGGETIH
jgi:hypothetical protein